MANKRQNKNFTSLTPEKKAKENADEFNGTVFKSMLKDPSKAFKGKLSSHYIVNKYGVIDL